MARLVTWLAALWWGGTTVLAFVVPPVLFGTLSQRSEAATLAATYFSIQAGACVVLALACALWAPRGDGHRRWQGVCGLAVAAALFNLAVAGPALQQHASSGILWWPFTAAQWHGVASSLVLLQWLVAAWTLARAIRALTRAQST